MLHEGGARASTAIAGFVFASLARGRSHTDRISGRCPDRLRRHVRPLAGGRGRDRAGLSSGHAAFELEILHGEPARRPAPFRHASVHRHRRRARRARAAGAKGETPPLYYHYLSTFASSFDQWDSVQTVNFPRGHGILKGYMGLRPDDPDTKEYVAAMYQAYGEKQAEEYLGRSIHHVLIYPYLSVQSPLQQLRVSAAGGAQQDPVGDLAFPLEGRLAGHLPARAVVLQPGQFAGHHDQRRRPGELDQGPVGPGVRRRRLGQLSPQPRRRHPWKAT